MGGLYNALFGYNPACVWLAPMIADKNPQEFFPRFRDCFLGEDNNTIIIYTRVGGGNRSYETYEPYEPYECYDEEYSYGEDRLYRLPTFIRTWDDDFDSTYGYYEFGVPDEWRADFDAIVDGRLENISSDYVERMQACYPSLGIREIIDGLIQKKENKSNE